MIITNTQGRAANGMFASRFSVELEVTDLPQYWREVAIQKRKELVELIGHENYPLWAEVTWPEDEINEHTWQELAQEFQAAIDLGKDALIDFLTCPCVLPDQHCAVCCAQARITARVEELL